MKKILFLLPAEYPITLLDPLIKKLQAAGATVKIMCACKAGVDTKSDLKYDVWNWTDFFFAPIYDFDPHRIIVWNGYAEDTITPTKALRNRYRVAITEMGWLPQRETMYCLDDAASACRAGTRGTNTYATLSVEDQLAVAELRKKYKPDKKATWLPDKFIFIPMQLEHDTVIKSFSPSIKKMSKLVACVLHSSPVKVVVKPHPKAVDAPIPPGCLRVPDGMPIKDIAPYASAVVGVNSTVLIESLIYNDRVIAFGGNIAKDVMGDGEQIMLDWSSVLSAQPPPRKVIDYVLASLLRTQYRWSDPPDTVVTRILSDGPLWPVKPEVLNS